MEAWYGDPNNQLRGADVTDTLRALLEGSMRVAVTNENMGCDPVPGVVKVLRVTVSFADGKRETRCVAERQWVVLEGLLERGEFGLSWFAGVCRSPKVGLYLFFIY